MINKVTHDIDSHTPQQNNDENFIATLMWSFIRQHWPWYLAILITLLGVPIQKLVIPSQYGTITEQIQNRSLGKARGTLWIILSLWLVVSVLDIIKSYILKTLWPRFSNYCREEMLRAILTKYSYHYEAVKTGLIQSKINDVPWVLDSIFNLLQKIIFENATLVISTAVYLALLDWRLLIVFIIGIIILGAISYDYIRRSVPYVQATEDVYQNYFEEISEILSNIMSIFTNNQEEYNVRKIHSLIQHADKDYKQIRNLAITYKVMYYIVCLALFLGLLLIGLQLYKDNKLNSSQLVGLFIISYTLLGSLMLFYYNSKDIIINKGSIDVINKWYNSMPKEHNINDVTGKHINVRSNMPLDIDIRGLWFRYCNGAAGGHVGRCADEDNNTEDGGGGWLYRGLDLQIREGEHVVITGHIGSGKSTFAKILIRLHSLDSENSRGHIFFGGQNISSLDPRWIRQMVTYTPQKTGLFNDTLWNNIQYGLDIQSKKQVTPQTVLTTLREAGLDSVADKFAQLMHKPVGKSGGRLSGGQQQIIWLLRAMFNSSRWVVLDEPTNNLDPESVQNVKNLIRRIQKSGKTTIIITHDNAVHDLGVRHLVFVKGTIGSDTQH